MNNNTDYTTRPTGESQRQELKQKSHSLSVVVVWKRRRRKGTKVFWTTVSQHMGWNHLKFAWSDSFWFCHKIGTLSYQILTVYTLKLNKWGGVAFFVPWSLKCFKEIQRWHLGFCMSVGWITTTVDVWKLSELLCVPGKELAHPVPCQKPSNLALFCGLWQYLCTSIYPWWLHSCKLGNTNSKARSLTGAGRAEDMIRADAARELGAMFSFPLFIFQQQ